MKSKQTFLAVASILLLGSYGFTADIEETNAPDEHCVCIYEDQKTEELFVEEELSFVELEAEELAIVEEEQEELSFVEQEAEELVVVEEELALVEQEAGVECAARTRPPILGLALARSVQLDKVHNFTSLMEVDEEITSEEADAYFALSENGIEIKQEGLYQIDFFQEVSTDTTSCDATLVLSKGCYESDILRAQKMRLRNADFKEFAFKKILKLAQGDVITMKTWPLSGYATLEGESYSSGWTIKPVE